MDFEEVVINHNGHGGHGEKTKNRFGSIDYQTSQAVERIENILAVPAVHAVVNRRLTT
ncbi:MAG: hypothetical protein QM739_14735 [Propionivibrio sp.]